MSSIGVTARAREDSETEQGWDPGQLADREETATLLAKDQVIWSLGEPVMEIRGGVNREAFARCYACPASLPAMAKSTRKVLILHWKINSCSVVTRIFVCIAEESFWTELSRDHVIPTSKGGSDIWTNVVTSCRRCNNRKADRTPEQANMELLAIPFVPNQYEFLYLSNHAVLADQMEFLSARFSRNIRLI